MVTSIPKENLSLQLYESQNKFFILVLQRPDFTHLVDFLATDMCVTFRSGFSCLQAMDNETTWTLKVSRTGKIMYISNMLAQKIYEVHPKSN
jgi:hypothetical protein